MSIKHWYPFYPSDFQRDTELLTPAERGFYRDMLDAYWINDGKLSLNDAQLLMKKRGYSPQTFRKLWKVISNYFPTKCEELSNKRLDFELVKALKNKETAVANGRAGGIAKEVAKQERKGQQKPSSLPLPLPLPIKDILVVKGVPEKHTGYFEHMINRHGYCNRKCSAFDKKNLEQVLQWKEDGVTLGELDVATAIAKDQKPNDPTPDLRYIAAIIVNSNESKPPIKRGITTQKASEDQALRVARKLMEEMPDD